MDKVLYHGTPIQEETLTRAVAGLQILHCSTRKELADSLIREEDVVAVIINMGAISVEHREFIISLSSHYPLVKLALLLNDREEVAHGPNSRVFLPPFEGEIFIQDLHAFVFTDAVKNRRHHNRFEWLLLGYLQEGETEGKYEVHSLSGGGAFLKSEGYIPPPRQKGTVRIEFKNVRLSAECEILEQRSSSSNLPFGFPIRFLSLSEDSERIIDSIVNDALYQELVHPKQAVEAPTLGEDLLTPDFSTL